MTSTPHRARWVALVLLSCSCASSAPDFGHGAPAERAKFLDPLWDDGNAEVARYAFVDRRYGRLYEGDAILITCTERFDAEKLVKADGDDHRVVLDVVKLMEMRFVRTGEYDFREMATSFLTRAAARPVKLAISSQDWCGQTSKRLTVDGARARLATDSYYGYEGRRDFELALGDDTLLADALPLWLRTLDLERGGTRRVRVLDNQLFANAWNPEIRAAEIEVGASATIDVPAGSFEVVPVEVRRGARRETFWLARAAPHVLVRWDHWDGGSHALRYVCRAQYWGMNEPADEGALERLAAEQAAR